MRAQIDRALVDVALNLALFCTAVLLALLLAIGSRKDDRKR